MFNQNSTSGERRAFLEALLENDKDDEEVSCYLLYAVQFSAVHRSRRAGAGVLTYFAGAGAGVCSPPVKL